MSWKIQPIIAAGTQLTNAQATYFTATVRTRIEAFNLTNTSDATPYTVNVNWVPSGGAAGAANLVVNDRILLPGESWSVYPLIGQTLAIGDFISMIASTTLVVNAQASGLLMTP